ncbi:MAG: dihydrodiol dehydrogenase [Streptomycetales bacterium]
MDEPEIVLANEFSEVVVSKVGTRNGVRLRIREDKAGREILLCPLELESLTWQTPDTFSRLLSTPFGPEEPEAED